MHKSGWILAERRQIGYYKSPENKRVRRKSFTKDNLFKNIRVEEIVTQYQNRQYNIRHPPKNKQE